MLTDEPMVTDEMARTRCRRSCKNDVVVLNRKAFRRLTGAAVWLLNNTVDADQHLLGVGASVAKGEPIGLPLNVADATACA